MVIVDVDIGYVVFNLVLINGVVVIIMVDLYEGVVSNVMVKIDLK